MHTTVSGKRTKARGAPRSDELRAAEIGALREPDDEQWRGAKIADLFALDERNDEEWSDGPDNDCRWLAERRGHVSEER